MSLAFRIYALLNGTQRVSYGLSVGFHTDTLADDKGRSIGPIWFTTTLIWKALLKHILEDRNTVLWISPSID